MFIVPRSGERISCYFCNKRPCKVSQGFHRAPQGHGRLGPSAALGEGVRELREGSPAGKAATPPSSLREPRTPYPLPRSASGEGRTRSYPADAPGDPRPGIGRGPGLPSPSRHACGRTDGGDASKSMAAFTSYSQHRKWKFPGPGPSREVTDRCSRELFARRRRGSYSPGEGPVAALRPALALPAAPAPLPALHPSHPRGLCVEFAGLVGGDSGGPGSSRLYISPFPTPSLVLGRETPGAWVSFSLEVLLAGPSGTFGKGQRLLWHRCFAADGVEPRGLAGQGRSEKELGPRNRDSPEALPTHPAEHRARLFPSVGWNLGADLSECACTTERIRCASRMKKSQT